MKTMLVCLMALMLASCGKGSSGSGSSNTISNNYQTPSTVDGYLLTTGMLLINDAQYQMASSYQGSQLNQMILSSGIQPTLMNGTYAYRAHLTGGLYNQCSQFNQIYGNNCLGNTQSNIFYVSNIQFY